MNSQSAMGRTNGAVKLEKVEDRHVQASIFSLSFFTVSPKQPPCMDFYQRQLKIMPDFRSPGTG